MAGFLTKTVPLISTVLSEAPQFHFERISDIFGWSAHPGSSKHLEFNAGAKGLVGTATTCPAPLNYRVYDTTMRCSALPNL